MPGRTRHATVALALLLLAGCATPDASDTAMPDGVDPEAPVAAGYPAMPVPGEPTPLGDRLPSGLYASPPSADTLAALATAAPSPDGLFRAVLRNDGLWVTRIDGAWLWQVRLPATTAPQAGAQGQAPASGQTDTEAGDQAQMAAGGAQGEIPNPVGPLQWTARSTLLFSDTAGRWLEAEPLTARVVPLNAFLNGATNVTPSPDGSRVLFYKGSQLYTALRDGSQPTLVGENATGYWDDAGQLVVLQKPDAQPQQ